MSEINIEFNACFDDPDALRLACDGFEALSVEDFDRARQHFESMNVDLWIEPGNPHWYLEGFSREGNLCEGIIIAPESGPLDPGQFFKRLASLGPYLLWGSIVRETGEQRSVGFKAGKKVPASRIKKELTELSPSFALRAALDGSKTKDALRLLEEGVNPNVRIRGYPSVVYCARWASLNLMEALISAGADVNAPDEEGKTALIVVSEQFKERPAAYTRVLLTAGADPNCRDREGNTPLKAAVTREKDALKVVRMLIDAGARVTEHGGGEHSPLLLAVIALSYRVFTCSDPSERNKAAGDATKLLQLLLDAGDDPAGTCPNGGNLLAHAMLAPEIAAFVRSLGAERAQYPRNAYGGGSLHNDLLTAIHFGDSETLATLLSDAGFRELDKTSLLAQAIMTRNAGTVHQLVDAGCDPSAFYDYDSGQRLFDLAYSLGEQELGDSLKEAAL